MAFKNLRAELAELFAEETFDPSPELLSDGRLSRQARLARLRRAELKARARLQDKLRRAAVRHAADARALPPLEPVAACRLCRAPLYTDASLRRHHCRRITPPV